MNWKFWQFNDNRPRGLTELTIQQGGLVGKINNYPIKNIIIEVKENERVGNMSNIDVVGGQEANRVKRDIYPNGSWVPTNKINWLK